MVICDLWEFGSFGVVGVWKLGSWGHLGVSRALELGGPVSMEVMRVWEWGRLSEFGCVRVKGVFL